ncbi:unnamed protein product, partial [Heterotrigona itama]
MGTELSIKESDICSKWATNSSKSALILPIYSVGMSSGNVRWSFVLPYRGL